MLHVITDAANGAASVHETIQVTLDEICAYTGWPVGHAYFVGEDSEMLIRARSGISISRRRFESFRQVTEATRFRRGEGLPGSVLERAGRSGLPTWPRRPTSRARSSRCDIGVVAAFAFPVLAGATVVAVLEFFSGRAGGDARKHG